MTELTADTEITMADHSYDKSLPVDKSGKYSSHERQAFLDIVFLITSI